MTSTGDVILDGADSSAMIRACLLCGAELAYGDTVVYVGIFIGGPDGLVSPYGPAHLSCVVGRELDRQEAARQETCRHARSGTLDKSGELRCDDCGKMIGEGDYD